MGSSMPLYSFQSEHHMELYFKAASPSDNKSRALCAGDLPFRTHWQYTESTETKTRRKLSIPVEIHRVQVEFHHAFLQKWGQARAPHRACATEQSLFCNVSFFTLFMAVARLLETGVKLGANPTQPCLLVGCCKFTTRWIGTQPNYQHFTHTLVKQQREQLNLNLKIEQLQTNSKRWC